MSASGINNSATPHYIQQAENAIPGWPPQRRCRRPHPARTQAGLLDLFRGGSSNASHIRVDTDGEALKQCLQARGLPPQKLTAAAVPGSGRGLVAAQRFNKGDSLLCIPKQLMLTPAAAQQQSCLRALLEEQPLPAWSVLALWLAEQRAAGSSGEWWPYVRLLPERTGCVLEWSDEEVEWLCGSQLHREAQEIRQAAKNSWIEMQPLMAAAKSQGLLPAAGTFSRDALQWAFAMLLSRLVRLAALGDQEALLPWADLLNHDCSAASFLDWSPQEGAVVLRADRRYRAGEQVQISYGQKTSGELLLSYGFCPEPGSNPHDGCRLQLQLNPQDSALDWKAAAMRQHGLAASQLFPLRMAAAPNELLPYAAFVAADVASGEEALQLAVQLFEAGEYPSSLRRLSLEAVIGACKEALAGYPRSLEADRAELDGLLLQDQTAVAAHPTAPCSGTDQPLSEVQQRQQRRHQVLQTLVYERQVLNRIVFVLQQELREVQRPARTRS